jgi:hypothetical protein
MTNEVVVPTGQGDQQSHDSSIRDHEPHHPYRVRGIPANSKVNTASKLLKSVLGADNFRMRIRSLALDPYDPQYKVATVTFDKRPESFTPKKSEWRFHIVPEIDSSEDEHVTRDDQIIVDTHFHGFTALNSFKDEKFHLIE